MMAAGTIMTTSITTTTSRRQAWQRASGRDARSEHSPADRADDQAQGPDILRLKGILSFKGDAERYVVQGVHMIIEGNHQRTWKDGETRESRLVFIGRNLDQAALKAGFEACLA
jgi:G3E family GTPase